MNRELGGEKLFAASLAIPDGTYLGDTKVLNDLFRVFGKEALDIMHASETGAIAASTIETEAGKLADVFLGKNERFVPVENWNDVRGGLAPWLRGELNIDELDPHVVVRTALVIYATQLVQLEAYANLPETLDEQWQWQPEAFVEEFTIMFLGLPQEKIE